MDIPDEPADPLGGAGTGRPPDPPRIPWDRPGADRATLDWPGGAATDREAAIGPPGATVDPPVPPDTADYAMAAWAAELSVDGAAEERRRTQWLRQQAAEEGTWRGVLQDLAERARPVLAQLVNGRLHRGTITAVGADFVALRVGGTGPNRAVLVRHGALFTVRTTAGEPVTVGDRWLPPSSTLLEVLLSLRDDRATITVFGSDPGYMVRGELRSVGRDVITLRLDADGGNAYVALDSAVEMSLDESG